MPKLLKSLCATALLALLAAEPLEAAVVVSSKLSSERSVPALANSAEQMSTTCPPPLTQRPKSLMVRR